MKVLLIDKITREKIVFEENLTEKQAMRICEEWGWSYCDENGRMFWLEYEGE